MHFHQNHKKVVNIWLWLLVLSAFLIALHQLARNNSLSFALAPGFPIQPPADVTLVVASQRKDNTTWLQDTITSWEKKIYVTDDPHAENKVPKNRGREVMAYLTYIIENYNNLPKVVVFHHAKRYQWHNDDPLFDGERVLLRLHIPYVEKQGYVNLRCAWTLGCPVEIHPLNEEDADADPTSSDTRAGSFYKAAFQELFPESTVPQAVGVSCCAQFAVSGQRIRERPREDYERYRRWLLHTPLADSLSGRILEYSWHIMFGEEAVYCPNASVCYCNLFGLCDIQCEDEGNCRSQYVLPKYSDLPSGWPDVGWDGKWRNVTQLRAEQELDYRPGSIASARQIM